jgi:hypothetical protein
MQASLQEPKESLAALIPKADFIARVDNNHSIPVLEAVEVIDRSGCWDTIKKRFASLDVQAHEFPNHLIPLRLQTIPCILHQCLTLKSRPITGEKSAFSLDLRLLDHDILAAWSSVCDITLFELEGSAVHAAPRDPEKRNNQGLCDVAMTQAWIYEISQPQTISEVQVTTSWRSKRNLNSFYRVTLQDGKELKDARTKFVDDLISLLSNFLLGGGFVYFDKDGGIAQMQFHATKNSSSLDLISRMQFDSRVDMPPQIVEELKRKNRWASPNIDFFLKRGVTSYAWCVPGEVICGHVMPPSGAFAFLFGNGQALYFPVLE